MIKVVEMEHATHSLNVLLKGNNDTLQSFKVLE